MTYVMRVMVRVRLKEIVCHTNSCGHSIHWIVIAVNLVRDLSCIDDMM